MYVITEKKVKFLCAIFRILIHLDPKIFKSLSYSPFRYKDLVSKCD